ncbi:MAG: hypothetical protein KC777_03430 [Cyanobacteria bacterium HKST-UBA02]|nr:hypothetical protein [Cyanobacteria bacterium HKST-UBA02]
MLEDLFEVATGRWGIAAAVLLLLPGGRKLIRRAVKESIKLGYSVSDFCGEIVSEARETTPALACEKEGDGRDAPKARKVPAVITESV